MADKDAGGIIRSEDPGETIEEAGIAGDVGDAGEGEPDDAKNTSDTEGGSPESDEAGAAGDDRGGEGEEAGGDRGEDAGEDKTAEVVSEVDALKEILKKRDEELSEIKKAAAEKAAAPAEKAAMTDEQWAALEDRFGGLPRNQIQPLAEMVERAAANAESRILGRLVAVEKELTIARLAESDGTRDIRAHREGVEKFLKNFDTKMHSDEKLLRMALAYARGEKSSGAQKPSNGKERNLRVAGAGKPNIGGSSAGGVSGGLGLTRVEKDAARVAGMSEKEYAGWKKK